MMAEEFDVSKVRSISVDSLAVGSKIYLVLEDGARIWAGGRITESQTTTEEKNVWDEKPDIEQMITDVKWLSNAALDRTPCQNQFRGLLIELKRVEPWLDKVKKHIEWQQSYIDATQLIVNQFAFHDDTYWWKGMNLDEMQEKAEGYNKFLREADKETIFNMGSWKSDINTLNKIQKACRQMSTIDVAHKEDELARLPHRILQILGVPTCPACGLVAEESPCPHCGNDVGMEYGSR